jgi:hypothetical protein
MAKSKTAAVSFTADEIMFLMSALRTLPLSGTPDLLADLLPRIDTIRLKIAQAAARLGVQQTAGRGS